MQALIEMIVGLIAALAALALSQFGLDLHTPRDAEPRPREVHRVKDCGDDAPKAFVRVTENKRDC